MGKDSSGKESACSAGDTGDGISIPPSRRSQGGGNGNLPQYCCWEVPMTEEPGGLESKGLHRVRHDWVTKHAHTCARYALFIHNFSLNQYC